MIRTERGEIRVELYADEAPGYVNNFVFLARNGFYEGLTFHRVVPGFVAQGGRSDRAPASATRGTSSRRSATASPSTPG